MVSLTHISKSFDYQLNSLEICIRQNFNWESPESGFANYIFNCFTNQLFCSAEEASFASLEESRLCQAPMLATIGYQIASGKKFEENFLNSWANGLTRLSSREVFTPDRASFFYRPVELLGICLGVSNCSQVRSKDLAWLENVLRTGEQKLAGSNLWTYLLGILAANSLSIMWKPRIRLLPEEMTIEELALTKFFCNFRKSIAQILALVQLEELIDNTLLERCIVNTLTPQDLARASILYCSLKQTVTRIVRSNCKQYWEVGSNSLAAIEFIDSFSDRFDRATQQLQSHDDIDSLTKILNQYNVNDLLTNLLDLQVNVKTILKIVNSIDKNRSSTKIIKNSLTFTGNNITMNDNRNNVEVQQAFHAPTYGVIGNNEGNQNIFISEQKQTLAEAAIEIQQLLKQLESSNPTASRQQQVEFVSMAIAPNRRQKFLSALDSGWKEAIKEFLDNPYVNVAIAIIEGWKSAGES